jgi:hypothetical protein
MQNRLFVIEDGATIDCRASGNVIRRRDLIGRRYCVGDAGQMSHSGTTDVDGRNLEDGASVKGRVRGRITLLWP